MLKKIQQNPPKEVKLLSTESTSKGVLNGRTLKNAGKSTSIKTEPNVTTTGISNQQPSSDSSKMFNTIKQERANQTAADPVELFLKAIKRNPCCASDYVAISQDLSKGNFSESLSEKSKVTPQDILLKLITLYPEEAISYLELGTTLPFGGSAILPDGTRMAQLQLYQKSISLDPTLGRAYNNLAVTLPAGGRAALSDGTRVTKQQFFLKSISLDPTCATVYLNLATTLPNGDNIAFPDRTVMTQQQLLLKSISLDHTNVLAYQSLGATLPARENIALPDETGMTKQQLYSCNDCHVS